jgi:hypothetical protein
MPMRTLWLLMMVIIDLVSTLTQPVSVAYVSLALSRRFRYLIISQDRVFDLPGSW